MFLRQCSLMLLRAQKFYHRIARRAGNRVTVGQFGVVTLEAIPHLVVGKIFNRRENGDLLHLATDADQLFYSLRPPC